MDRSAPLLPSVPEHSLSSECSRGPVATSNRTTPRRRDDGENEEGADGMTMRKGIKTIRAAVDNSVITYSAEELLTFQTHPPSSSWPKFLDQSFKNKRGKWDPESWHPGRKPVGAAADTGGGGDRPKASKNSGDRPASSMSSTDRDSKKPLKDPKERIKAEQQQECLVLSPQRRSFNTGCQVGHQPSQSNDATKESTAKDRLASGNAGGGRRVGSGRLLARGEDHEAGGRNREREFGGGYRRRGGDSESEASSWFDRRNNGCNGNNDDYEVRKQRDRRSGGGSVGTRGRGGSSSSRSSNHHHRRSDAAEEPEWMRETVCQDDVMELRGFDDSLPDDDGDEKKMKKRVDPPPPPPPKDVVADDEGPITVDGDEKLGGEEICTFDDILHLDAIPGLANILADENLEAGHEANGGVAMPRKEAGGGRFSQFFQKEGTGGGSHSSELRRAEAAKLQQPTVIRIPNPGDPSAYFAPISPAAQTTTTTSPPRQQQQQPAAAAAGNHLMEILRGKSTETAVEAVDPSSSIIQLKQGREVKSVEELEAGMRQEAKRPSPNEQQLRERWLRGQNNDSTTEEDLSAFRKFAAMMSRSEESSGANDQGIGNQSMGAARPAPTPMDLMAERQRELQLGSMQNVGRVGMRPNGPPPPLVAAATAAAAKQEAQINREILQLIRQQPFNAEVLRRPEAVSLTACLEQNKVTPNLLLHQFIHGSLTLYHREILLNILKVAQNNGLLNCDGVATPPPPPARASPDSFLSLLQQQQQQHLKPGGKLSRPGQQQQQRAPSPQELMLHTQQIMQNALIRRKLEEQRDSYRKRMDVGVVGKGGDAPQSSGSPLAFTPTIVMKKMAADRRDSDPTLKMGLKIGSQAEDGSLGRGTPAIIGPQGDAVAVDPGKQLLEQFVHRGGMMPPPPQPPHVAAGGGGGDMSMLHQIRAQQQLQHQLAAAAAAGLHHHHPIDSRFLMQQRQPQTHLHSAYVGLPQFGPGCPLLPPPPPPPPNNSNMSGLLGIGVPGSASTYNSHGGCVPSPVAAPQPGGHGLSRFFSQEIIAQAQSGNAPSMPPLPTQQAMTLEEIELKAAAVRM